MRPGRMYVPAMGASIGSLCELGAGAVGLATAVLPTRRLPALRALAWAQGMLVASATGLLAVALLRVDGRYAEVADTTSRITPWPYRLAGLWGGLRGSMLFF